jgi:hypothetical protein
LCAVSSFVLYSSEESMAANLALRWAAPPTSQTKYVTTSQTTLSLSAGVDYRVVLPSSPRTHRLKITGGRNVVIIGGHIAMTTSPSSCSDGNVALAFKDQTGIIHIEGLLIDNPYGKMFDGIALQAPNAIFQIQNLRAVNFKGNHTSSCSDPYFHSDIIQNQGGARELRIHNLTGSTNYQGFFITGSAWHTGTREIQRAVMSNINLTALDSSTGIMWFGDLTTCNTRDPLYPTSFSNVYAKLYGTANIGSGYNSIVPSQNSPSPCRMSYNGSQATWPGIANYISGYITNGSPPNGDFVPSGSVGLRYTSPGTSGSTTTSPSPTPSPAPTTSASITTQAEFYATMYGIRNNGSNIGSLDSGDWAKYVVSLGSNVMTRFTARLGVPSSYAGQRVEIRRDSPTGTLLGVLTTTSTGAWTTFTDQKTTISPITGTVNLYLVFAPSYGVGNIDYFKLSNF